MSQDEARREGGDTCLTCTKWAIHHCMREQGFSKQVRLVQRFSYCLHVRQFINLRCSGGTSKFRSTEPGLTETIFLVICKGHFIPGPDQKIWSIPLPNISSTKRSFVGVVCEEFWEFFTTQKGSRTLFSQVLQEIEAL